MVAHLENGFEHMLGEIRCNKNLPPCFAGERQPLGKDGCMANLGVAQVIRRKGLIRYIEIHDVAKEIRRVGPGYSQNGIGGGHIPQPNIFCVRYMAPKIIMVSPRMRDPAHNHEAMFTMSCNRGFYYFSRRVPKEVQPLHGKQRIVLALNTRSRAKALKYSQVICQRLDERWLPTRLDAMGLGLCSINRKRDAWLGSGYRSQP